ncbi:hypothetical protein GCM10027442_22200 [Emticicia fontis]
MRPTHEATLLLLENAHQLLTPEEIVIVTKKIQGVYKKESKRELLAA